MSRGVRKQFVPAVHTVASCHIRIKIATLWNCLYKHLLQTDFHFYRRIYCIHTHTPNSNSCSDLNCQNNLFAFKLNLNGIQPTAFVNMSSHCMWAVSLFFFFFFTPVSFSVRPRTFFNAFLICLCVFVQRWRVERASTNCHLSICAIWWGKLVFNVYIRG